MTLRARQAPGPELPDTGEKGILYQPRPFRVGCA